MQENCFSMDMNAGSTNLQANGAGAGSLSRLEIIVLRNELFALRDRVTSLERQLSTIKQCTDCQMDRNLCVFCQELHSIQHCDYFKYLQVSDRWSVAKKLNLCYRCLDKSHYGLNCPQSKMCGINRCRLTHSVLLHNEEKRKGWRKLRAERHHVTSPSEPSGESEVNEPIGPISNLDLFDDEYLLPEGQSNRIKAPSGGNNMCNLDSFDETRSPHEGETVACDRKTDQEKMVENNSSSINTGSPEELNQICLTSLYC